MFVRVSNDQLWARVKGDLPIEFSAERVSAHGGLELLGRYLRALELRRRLREARRGHLEADYGVWRLVFAGLALIVVGGWRISHLAFLGTDPVVRFCGLQRRPSDRTRARFLKPFSSGSATRPWWRWKL